MLRDKNDKFLNFIVECGCNPEGSQNGNCDSYGQCSCNVGFTGTKCNGCATGYTGYPNCTSKFFKDISYSSDTLK